MLTDEMIRKSKLEHGYKGFTIIDDDYVVITGDQSDIERIKKTNDLRAEGVNYCGPIDYKDVEGKIYLLEHRALGEPVDLQKEYIERGSSYLLEFMNYFNNLKRINGASIEQLNHFFDDIEKMRQVNIIPDVCSLSNLFYDEKAGFSFIDVYPGSERLDVDNIFYILINTKFSISGVSLLPLELAQEYNNVIASLYAKIVVCLKKYDYPEDKIKEYLEKGIHSFGVEDIVPSDEINDVYNARIDSTKIVISL